MIINIKYFLFDNHLIFILIKVFVNIVLKKEYKENRVKPTLITDSVHLLVIFELSITSFCNAINLKNFFLVDKRHSYFHQNCDYLTFFFSKCFFFKYLIEKDGPGWMIGINSTNEAVLFLSQLSKKSFLSSVCLIEAHKKNVKSQF